MLTGLPAYISLLFVLTALGTVTWFYIACKSRMFLLAAVMWTIIQSLVAWSGVYQDTSTVPPKLMVFGFLPTVIIMIIMFVTTSGRRFIDQIDLRTLTYFHSIRIPVEIVLALLFHYGVVSRYVTIEGTNFDLFSGLSAPVIGYLVFRQLPINRTLLLIWNIICLLLLVNVVATAIVSIPTPFQQLSFDQPTIAVLYFPFSLLPTVVVPLVLFAHLVAFRRLTNKNV